jgi:hypothetical protein
MSAEASAERVPLPGDYRFDAAHVAAAFSEHAPEFRFWDQGARFKVVELGAVVITSGAVIADDPLFGWLAPFERRIPPGTYPVSLALVQLSSGDERIAFARLLISPAAVIAWESAWNEPIPQSIVLDGKSHVVPRQYAFYCSTETGVGCFMDAAAIPAIRNWDHEVYTHHVMDGLEDHSRNTWSSLSFQPDPARPETIVCYRTEPGCHPSHFGLDANGNAAVIVTDFRMF